MSFPNMLLNMFFSKTKSSVRTSLPFIWVCLISAVCPISNWLCPIRYWSSIGLLGEYASLSPHFLNYRKTRMVQCSVYESQKWWGAAGSQDPRRGGGGIRYAHSLRLGDCPYRFRYPPYPRALW